MHLFVLAQYGEIIKPDITEQRDNDLLILADLVKHRRQISDVYKQTKQWLEKQPNKRSEDRIKALQEVLENQLKQIRPEIKKYIKK